MRETDCIILGTGQAATPLAGKLVAAGKRVVIIERGEVGGTCVNFGCTPTKTLIASAKAAHGARTAGRLGVRTGDVVVDFPAVVARKDGMVKRWQAGVQKRLAANPELLTLVKGHGRFVGERTVEVAGERYRGETVVIDVGARPRMPEVKGLNRVPTLDNASLMALTELPGHLLTLGGGYIGCEFAQAFRRFGAKVTMTDPNPHLMSALDPEASEAIERVFRDEGIELCLGLPVTEVRGRAGEVTLVLADGRTVSGTHLLVATGRTPNTNDLGCEAGSITLDARGYITVDEKFRTSAAGVYAVGDCTGEPAFTHVAWDDHRILADVLLGRGNPRPRSHRHIPFAVFTDPQIAGVGLTEKEATAKGVPYEVARYAFSSVARAIETDELPGMFKLLVNPADETILGATFVGSEVAELIHVVIALMEAKASARAIVDSEAVHPAFAEGIQSALMSLPRFQ